MIRKIRKTASYLLPVIAFILVAGLILSRIFRSDSSPPEPQVTISADQAVEYVGTAAEVCGKVASADYLPNVNGQPTFLNFGEPHPDQIFTAVIFGDHRNRFRRPPEEAYLNNEICVSGSVEMHENVPQIVVSRPAQITLDER